MITVSALNDILRIRHGFFTREGGVSQGLYASLNVGLSSKDDRANVIENRRRAMAMIDLGPEALVTVRQEHTNKVVRVDKAFGPEDAPVADAMVTSVRGLALGVLTADCAPVLFADEKAGVIGAAHSGWKGAISGVLDATIDAMVELGAKRADIVAAVGPCITPRSYEVGPEFSAPFLAENPDNERWFNPSRREGHFLFDLPGYVTRKMAKLGLETVVRTPCDTCTEESRFFSYRRATLRQEPDYGRQLSAIVLEK